MIQKKAQLKAVESLRNSLGCLNMAVRDPRRQPIIHTSALYVVVQQLLLMIELLFFLSFFLHYLGSMLSSVPFQEADAPTAAGTLGVNHPEEGRGCCGHRCGLLLFTRAQSHSGWVSCDRSHSYLIAESRRNLRRSQPLMSFRGNF